MVTKGTLKNVLDVCSRWSAAPRLGGRGSGGVQAGAAGSQARSSDAQAGSGGACLGDIASRSGPDPGALRRH